MSREGCLFVQLFGSVSLAGRVRVGSLFAVGEVVVLRFVVLRFVVLRFVVLRYVSKGEGWKKKQTRCVAEGCSFVRCRMCVGIGRVLW